MSTTPGGRPAARWVRRHLAGALAVVVVAGVYAAGRLPETPPADVAAAASGLGFEPRTIGLPAGLPHQVIREVNQDYRDIDAWISSVGAGIALNDLDADRLPNDLCVTDPRTDAVSVTPAPDVNVARYAPFALVADPLPVSAATAPMGCTPADLDEDGRMDLVVHYWGRTPIVFLNRAEPGTALSAGAFRPVELVPGAGTDGYVGPQWNTNTVTVADFDGDGHVDVHVGNYFPDGPVLDPTVAGGVEMNDSLSNATNGGGTYFFRSTGVDAAGVPTFDRRDDVLPDGLAHGWVLGASAIDADGDALPELYLAQDHGRDAMLHNRSTPGRIVLEPVLGASSPTVPRSKTVGRDSFKGMAVDWGDLDGDGLYDLFVSNITTSFGIEESNFQFMSTAGSRAELRADLAAGVAPWADTSTAAGTAWSGWAWDVKTGDFDNSGDLSIVQANGFVRGETNRWPQLQELATANDLTVRHPEWWPHVRSGDDIAGDQRLHLFTPAGGGRYENVAPALGLDAPVPTRGIATGDTDGDGLLDLAVARQWDEPVFLRNTSEPAGEALTLALSHEGTVGSPVVGAQVRVTLADGRIVSGQVDGGGGHSGRRSSEVHLGLGDVGPAPVTATITWRDRAGAVHSQDVRLAPGRHDLTLGSAVGGTTQEDPR